MSSAVIDVHFKVLAKSNRNLKISDFKKYGTVPSAEKKKLQGYLGVGAKIVHLSTVKQKFCPESKG